MNRKPLAASAAAVLSATALVASGPSQAASDQPDPAPPPAVRKVVDSPIAEYAGGRTIEIDASGGFGAAHRLISENDDALEGWTIRFTGLATATGKQRQRDDERLMRSDPPIAPPKCPAEPPLTSRAPGRTIAYLGCNRTTGHETRGHAIAKSADHSLEEAVGDVLRSRFPDLEAWERVAARISPEGEATVSLPADFVESMQRSQKAEQYEMYRNLVFTAHSNGDIKSVGFTVEGDCLAYAMAVGGDICATEDLTRIGK